MVSRMFHSSLVRATRSMNQRKMSSNQDCIAMKMASVILPVALSKLDLSKEQINELVPQLLAGLDSVDEFSDSKALLNLSNKYTEYQVGAIHGILHSLIADQLVKDAKNSSTKYRTKLMDSLKAPVKVLTDEVGLDRSSISENETGNKKQKGFFKRIIRKGSAFMSKSPLSARSSVTSATVEILDKLKNEEIAKRPKGPTSESASNPELDGVPVSHFCNQESSMNAWIEAMSNASSLDPNGKIDFACVASTIEKLAENSKKINDRDCTLKMLVPYRRYDISTGLPQKVSEPKIVIVNSQHSTEIAKVEIGKWKIGGQIGKGSFGHVHVGINEDTGDLIAIKVLSLVQPDMTDEIIDGLYREIDLMRKLHHPNIVSYLGAELNDADRTISIFQQWVPSSITSLLINFGPFKERRIAQVTRQILDGLVYLHSKRVVHRDIKGSNILIDDRGVVKLCDFGASKLFDLDSILGVGNHTRVGTPYFMAPEILLRQDYGAQVDIWSLGGAILEMATGKPPYSSLNLKTPVALRDWIKKNDAPPPLPDTLSAPIAAFLKRCFVRVPLQRPTASQLLYDPFIELGTIPTTVQESTIEDSIHDLENMDSNTAIMRIRRLSTADHNKQIMSKSRNTPKSPSRALGASNIKLEDSQRESLLASNSVKLKSKDGITSRTIQEKSESTATSEVVTPRDSPNPYAGRRRRGSLTNSSKRKETNQKIIVEAISNQELDEKEAKPVVTISSTVRPTSINTKQSDSPKEAVTPLLTPMSPGAEAFYSCTSPIQKDTKPAVAITSTPRPTLINAKPSDSPKVEATPLLTPMSPGVEAQCPGTSSVSIPR